MNPNPELDPELDTLLQTLRRGESRNPQLAARARQNFLAEAAKMTAPVSISPRNRLEEWKETFRTFWTINRKEKSPMFNFVMAALLILGAVLGGGATTVAAAQDAQPNEILYPVKTWSEEVRIGWETDPQEKFELALRLTARRAEEINNLLAAGEVAPEPVLNRFQNQQQQAVQFAFGLPEELVAPALERVREQARQQEQAMQQLHLNDPACEQLRERVRDMLHTQAQTGLGAPAEPPASGPSYGPGEPQKSAPNEPPAPGPSYGPGEPKGPWGEDEPGFGARQQLNPWRDEPFAPGPGYGPGDGTCAGCNPATNGNGSPQNGDPQNGNPQNGGTQNGEPQNGGPGGNGDSGGNGGTGGNGGSSSSGGNK